MRHPVDFPYTRQELDALFNRALKEDVTHGGQYDARSDVTTDEWHAIKVWSRPWHEGMGHGAWYDPEPESVTIGTCYFHWTPTPMLWKIEPGEGYTIEDIMQELGRLELQALGYVKHGQVPSEE